MREAKGLDLKTLLLPDWSSQPPLSKNRFPWPCSHSPWLEDGHPRKVGRLDKTTLRQIPASGAPNVERPVRLVGKAGLSRSTVINSCTGFPAAWQPSFYGFNGSKFMHWACKAVSKCNGRLPSTTLGITAWPRASCARRSHAASCALRLTRVTSQRPSTSSWPDVPRTKTFFAEGNGLKKNKR